MSKSGMTWFRFYSDWRTNPKVKLLHETFQLRFIDLMCLRCEGEIPGASLDELAYHLRISKDEMAETLSTLEDAGLWADGDICKWDKRQYKSDNSTSRVKRFRKRQCNVTETPSETETETDTEGEEEAPPTKKQINFARSLLAVHGLTIDKWQLWNYPGTVFIGDEFLNVADIDKIVAQFKGKPVDNSPRPYLAPEAPDPDLTPEEREASLKALEEARGA